VRRVMLAKPREIRFPPATFAIDVPLREKLNRRARELGRSASYVVRLALTEHLAKPADPSARRGLDLVAVTQARRAHR